MREHRFKGLVQRKRAVCPEVVQPGVRCSRHLDHFWKWQDDIDGVQARAREGGRRPSGLRAMGLLGSPTVTPPVVRSVEPCELTIL